MVSGKILCDESMDSGLGQSREHVHSGNDILEPGKRERNEDVIELKYLMSDWGAESVSHFRWVSFSIF